MFGIGINDLHMLSYYHRWIRVVVVFSKSLIPYYLPEVLMLLTYLMFGNIVSVFVDIIPIRKNAP